MKIQNWTLNLTSKNPNTVPVMNDSESDSKSEHPNFGLRFEINLVSKFMSPNKNEMWLKRVSSISSMVKRVNVI